MNSLLHQFTAAAVDVLGVDAERINPTATFAGDLDADSLDLVELVMRLEESLGITVDEDELKDIETVNDALELLQAKL